MSLSKIQNSLRLEFYIFKKEKRTSKHHQKTQIKNLFFVCFFLSLKGLKGLKGLSKPKTLAI